MRQLAALYIIYHAYEHTPPQPSTESPTMTFRKYISDQYLKRHNQAKIIFLFWFPNMTVSCKHVHRLELQMFFYFCVAHLPVKRDIKTKFPYFLFYTCMSEIRNREFRLYILTGKCATQKLKLLRNSSLWTCSHHIAILLSENKVHVVYELSLTVSL